MTTVGDEVGWTLANGFFGIRVKQVQIVDVHHSLHVVPHPR
jgi:hypothetical protein